MPATRNRIVIPLDEVTDTPETLITLGLVVRMSLQPGQKEARYSHLMCVPPDETNNAVTVSQAPSPQDDVSQAERIAALEEKVSALCLELDDLKRTIQDFRRQFE